MPRATFGTATMNACVQRLVVCDHTARRQNGQRYRYPVVRVGARVLRRMGWRIGDEVELRYSARRGVIELRRAVVPRPVSRLLTEARAGLHRPRA